MSNFLEKVKNIVGGTEDYQYYDDELDSLENNKKQEKKTDNKELISNSKKTAKSIVAKILGEAKYSQKTVQELDKLKEEYQSGEEKGEQDDESIPDDGVTKEMQNNEAIVNDGEEKEDSKNVKDEQKKNESRYELNLKGEDQKKGKWKDFGRNLKNTFRSVKFAFGEKAYKEQDVLESIAPDIASKLDNYIDQLFDENKEKGDEFKDEGAENFIDELDSVLSESSQYGGLDRMQKLQLRQALDIVLDIKRVTVEDQVEKNKFNIEKKNQDTDLDSYNKELDKLNQELTSEDYKKVSEDIGYDMRMKLKKSIIGGASRAITGLGTFYTGGLGGAAFAVFGAGAEGFLKTLAVKGKSEAMMERDRKRLTEKNYSDLLVERDLSGVEKLFLEGKNFEIGDKLKEKLDLIQENLDLDDKTKLEDSKKLTWAIDRIKSGSAEILPATEISKRRDEFKAKFIEDLREQGSPFELNKEEFKQAWKEECEKQKYVPLETAEQLYRKGDIIVDGKEYDDSEDPFLNDKDSILSQSKQALNKFLGANMRLEFRKGNDIISKEEYDKLTEEERKDVTIDRTVKDVWNPVPDSPEKDALKKNYEQLLDLRDILKPKGGGSKKNSYKDIRLIKILDRQIEDYKKSGLFYEENTDTPIQDNNLNSENDNIESGENKDKQSRIQEKINLQNQKLEEYNQILDYKKNEKVFSKINQAKSMAWNSAMAGVGNALAYLSATNFGQGFELDRVSDSLSKESVQIQGDNLAIAEHIKDKVSGVFGDEVKGLVDNSLDYNQDFWEKAFEINGEGEWVSKFEEGVGNRVVDFTQYIGENNFSIQDILQDKAQILIDNSIKLGGSSFVAPWLIDKMFNRDKKENYDKIIPDKVKTQEVDDNNNIEEIVEKEVLNDEVNTKIDNIEDDSKNSEKTNEIVKPVVEEKQELSDNKSEDVEEILTEEKENINENKISNLDSEIIRNKEYVPSEYLNQVDFTIGISGETWKSILNNPKDVVKDFRVYAPQRNQDQEGLNIIKLKDNKFALFPSEKTIRLNSIDTLWPLFGVSKLDSQNIDFNRIKPAIISGDLLDGDSGNYTLKEEASFKLIHKGVISIENSQGEDTNIEEIEDVSDTGIFKEGSFSGKLDTEIIDAGYTLDKSTIDVKEVKEEENELEGDENWEEWVDEEDENVKIENSNVENPVEIDVDEKEISEEEPKLEVDGDWEDWLEDEDDNPVEASSLDIGGDDWEDWLEDEEEAKAEEIQENIDIKELEEVNLQKEEKRERTDSKFIKNVDDVKRESKKIIQELNISDIGKNSLESIKNYPFKYNEYQAQIKEKISFSKKSLDYLMINQFTGRANMDSSSIGSLGYVPIEGSDLVALFPVEDIKGVGAVSYKKSFFNFDSPNFYKENTTVKPAIVRRINANEYELVEKGNIG